MNYLLEELVRFVDDHWTAVEVEDVEPAGSGEA